MQRTLYPNSTSGSLNCKFFDRILSRSREITVGKYDELSDIAEQQRLQSLQKAMVIQWLCFTPPSTIKDAMDVSSKLLLRALIHRYFLPLSFLMGVCLHLKGTRLVVYRSFPFWSNFGAQTDVF